MHTGWGHKVLAYLSQLSCTALLSFVSKRAAKNAEIGKAYQKDPRLSTAWSTTRTTELQPLLRTQNLKKNPYQQMQESVFLKKRF